MSYKKIHFKNLKKLPQTLLQDWRRRNYNIDSTFIPNELGIYMITLNLKKVKEVNTNFSKLSEFIPLYIGKGQLRDRFNHHKKTKKEFLDMHQYLEFWYLILYTDIKDVDKDELESLESELINSFYPVVNQKDELQNKNQENNEETTYTENFKIYLEKEEDLHLEFKETYQLGTFYKSGTKQYIKNDEMRIECLRTICAFLNAYGGNVIIGVKEKPEKEFIGIEPDLEKIFSSDFDQMKGNIIHSVRDLMGVYASKKIRVKKEIFDGKFFCKITVKKASKQIYLKDKKTEIFYFRDDHGDDPIKPSEINDIWNARQKRLR